MTDIKEPVKTQHGETIGKAHQPISLHISASVGDYDGSLADLEMDMPIDMEPWMSGNTLFVPKTDAKALTKRLTNGINAFIEAFASR